MTRSHRPGLTLVELLVTMSLVLMLFGIAYQVLLPSLNIWMVNQAQSAIEDTGMVLQAKLTSELERSVHSSVTVLPSGGPGLQGFSFCSWGEQDAEDVADSYDFTSGQTRWYRFVVYYVPPGSQNVYRKTWPVGHVSPCGNWPPQNPPMGGCCAGALNYTFPTFEPQALAGIDLTTLCTTTNGSERQVATSVTRLELDILPREVQGNNVILAPSNVTLRIDLQSPAPTLTHFVRTSRTQQVQLRM